MQNFKIDEKKDIYTRRDRADINTSDVVRQQLRKNNHGGGFKTFDGK